MALNSNPDYNEWMDIYKKLVYWELEMEKSDSPEMQEILQTQKSEANTEFFKFVSRNYASWVNPKSTDGPVMSHTLFKFKVLPHVEKGTPLFFILIDNFGLINGKPFNPFLLKVSAYWKKIVFTVYCLLLHNIAGMPFLPGLLPVDIEKQFPAAMEK